VLLAVISIPSSPDARQGAARATGLALADVNRRLAGVLPRVLLPALPADRVDDTEAALEALGFVVVAFDPALVPGDDQRLVARGLQLESGGLVLIDAQGARHVCPASSMALLQRGIRTSRTTEEVKTSERKFSVGRAVLSGGLMLSKKVDSTTVKTTETAEAFLLVQRHDGQADVMLYERRLDYRFLGPKMQASSRANLEVVWAHLRSLAPTKVDDRAVRPGFVSGLAHLPGDPVDLALYLVTLARAKESGAR
jgi:hypothetical protein